MRGDLRVAARADQSCLKMTQFTVRVDNLWLNHLFVNTDNKPQSPMVPPL